MQTHHPYIHPYPNSGHKSQDSGPRTRDPGPRPHTATNQGTKTSVCLSVDGRRTEDGVLVPLEHGSGTSSLIFMAAQEQCPAHPAPRSASPFDAEEAEMLERRKRKKVSPARTKVVGVFCANERRWRRRSCPVSVYLGICAAIYIHIYIYSYSCVCGLITFCLGARPSRPTEFPSPTPGPPFKKGLLKAKTHFYVCSSARLAVPYAPPLLLRPVSRTRSPFLPKVGPEDVCQAGTIVPAQPHRSLVLEKLQFSPRKKAKTSSWSRFDMARDQLPRRSNEFPSRQLGSIPGKGKIRDEK